VQGGVLAGAAKIIAVDVVPAKLELARRLGATHDRCGKDDPSPPSAISRAAAPTTPSRRSGNLAVIRQALDALGAGRRAHHRRRAEDRLALDFVVHALYQNKAILGCRYGTARPRRDFAMLADLYLAAGSRSTSSSRAATRSTSSPPRSTICAPGRLARGVFSLEVAPMGKFGPFVIDADGHGGEPADWQERLPREFQPHMAARRERISSASSRTCRASRQGDARHGARRQSLAAWHDRSRSRLEDMDLEGIDVTVMFPGGAGEEWAASTAASRSRSAAR